jgi:hypothetical protein
MFHLHRISGSRSCQYDVYCSLREVKPCSLLEVQRRFGRILYLSIHGLRVSQVRNKQEAGGGRRMKDVAPKRL